MADANKLWPDDACTQASVGEDQPCQQPGIARLAMLYEALAKAQGEMVNPAFDRENPHFRNKFASLAAVRDAVVPCLAKHGIALVQDVLTLDNAVRVVTILMHKDGASLTYGPLTMPTVKADAQGLAAAITYARRYALMSVACVVGDTDDDGNATAKREPDWRLYDKVYLAIQVGLESNDDWRILETWESLDKDQQIEMYANLTRWVPGGVTAWKEKVRAAMNRARASGNPADQPLGSD